MRHIAAIGAVALSLASPAAASQWKLISAGRDDAGHYLIFGDRESIKVTAPKMRRMWIVMVRAHPSKLGDEIDCGQDRVRSLSINAASETGEILYSKSEVGEWQLVPPDTYGQSEEHAACVGFPQSSFTLDDPIVQGRRLLLGEDPLSGPAH